MERSLFEMLCREAGQTLRLLIKPAAPAANKQGWTRTSANEEQVSQTVTLRRTVIEEVEIRPAAPAPPG